MPTEFRASQSLLGTVEGEAVVSDDALSVRYDIDSSTGCVTRPSHDLFRKCISDKVVIFRTTKGGVSTGWALLELKRRGTAPSALVCDVTNPVFVQGAVLAGIPIMDGFDPTPRAYVRTGDRVLVDGCNKLLKIIVET